MNFSVTAMGYQDNSADEKEHRKRVLEYGKNLEK